MPVPSLPEVCLYAAHPATGLSRLMDEMKAPYWAFPWAGGLALAQYIFERPETVDGRRVLDLGAGSGLVAIAAALRGASLVLAADIDRYARAAIGANAAVNGVDIDVVDIDLSKAPLPGVDLVLAGDAFYAPAVAIETLAILDRCRDAGLEVLIGDPYRPDLPRARLHRLVEYLVADVGLGGSAAMVPSAVFALRRPSI